MKILLLGFGSIGRHIVRLLDYEFTAMVRDLAAHRERGTLGAHLITDDGFDDAVAQPIWWWKPPGLPRPSASCREYTSLSC